jgi:hypothetical protein
MQARNFTPSQKHIKDYKTVANMEKAIAKHAILSAHPYTVHTFDDGRVTPVFHYNQSGAMECPIICIIHLGYSVVDGVFNVHANN